MKKSIVTFLSVAALSTVIGAPMIANAQEVRLDNRGTLISLNDHRDKDYEVLYRRHFWNEWRYYGTFEHHSEAKRAVERLEDRGFQTRLVKR